MKYVAIICTTVMIVVACNNTSNIGKTEEQTDAPTNIVAADTVVVLDSITSVDSASTVMPGEDIVEVTVPAHTLPVSQLQRTITSERQSLHVIITDLDPGALRVNISHNRPDANIRISQIVKPDGSTDGPFGRSLEYDIKQKGNYTLIINKSNMASGTQEGDVLINIER